jgi:cyclic patellamide precursor peptide PatG
MSDDETPVTVLSRDEPPVVDEPAAPPPSSPPAPAAPAFVYAIGRIEARFPSMAVEKELAQVTGRADTAGLTDREALRAVLTEPEHRYLARQMAWVLSIEGLETYILVPRDPASLDLLVEALRPTPRADDLDVVIGSLGPVAPPDMANGLTVPIAIFEQIYSFDVDALVGAMPRPPRTSQERFAPAAEELLGRVLQMADNAGALDEHRALNYLAVRYPAVYAKTAEAYAGNAALTAIRARPSRLSGARNIVDVIFTFTNRETDIVDAWFVRVDVTEMFPFLVTKLSPYYDR